MSDKIRASLWRKEQISCMNFFSRGEQSVGKLMSFFNYNITILFDSHQIFLHFKCTGRTIVYS